MEKKLLSRFEGERIPYKKWEELGWKIESADGYNYDLIKCPDGGLFDIGSCNLSMSNTSIYNITNDVVVILDHFPTINTWKEEL